MYMFNGGPCLSYVKLVVVWSEQPTCQLLPFVHFVNVFLRNIHL